MIIPRLYGYQSCKESLHFLCVCVIIFYMFDAHVNGFYSRLSRFNLLRHSLLQPSFNGLKFKLQVKEG